MKLFIDKNLTDIWSVCIMYLLFAENCIVLSFTLQCLHDYPVATCNKMHFVVSYSAVGKIYFEKLLYNQT